MILLNWIWRLKNSFMEKTKINHLIVYYQLNHLYSIKILTCP